jgi:hypothetical protein
MFVVPGLFFLVQFFRSRCCGECVPGFFVVFFRVFYCSYVIIFRGTRVLFRTPTPNPPTPSCSSDPVSRVLHLRVVGLDRGGPRAADPVGHQPLGVETHRYVVFHLRHHAACFTHLRITVNSATPGIKPVAVISADAQRESRRNDNTWGAGFKVWCLVFGVWCLGCRNKVFGFGVDNSGFWVSGLV